MRLLQQTSADTRIDWGHWLLISLVGLTFFFI
jgi:hypothetical protein